MTYAVPRRSTATTALQSPAAHARGRTLNERNRNALG